MAPYIFGQRNKITVVNLEKTVQKYLKRWALSKLQLLVVKRFVGTKRAARDIIAQEAERAGSPYVNNRWLGGMMTNFKTVKSSIKRPQKEMEAAEAGGIPS